MRCASLNLFANELEHVLEHRFGEAAGVEIVAGAMIAIDEDQLVVELVACPMLEGILDQSLVLGPHNTVMGNFA